MSVNLLIAIQFILMFWMLYYSLRNEVMTYIKPPLRVICVVLSLIPIWGVVLFVGAITCIYNDFKNAKKNNKQIFRNNFFNRSLFGEDVCYKNN